MDLNKKFKKNTKVVELGGEEGESPAQFHLLDPNSREGQYLLAQNLTPKEYKFIESGDISGLDTLAQAVDIQDKVSKSLMVNWENLQVDGKDLQYNDKNKVWLFENYRGLGSDIWLDLFSADSETVKEEAEVKKSSKSD